MTVPILSVRIWGCERETAADCRLQTADRGSTLGGICSDVPTKVLCST